MAEPQTTAARIEILDLDKQVPWLKEQIPDAKTRQLFGEWLADFADRHGWKGADGKLTKMTSEQLYGVLDNNRGFYEKVMREMEKNSTTEFQAGSRFWPKKENLQNVKETVLAAIAVGSTYGIEPLFIITIAGYESQFANVKGIGGTGMCQVNPKNSSLTALGKAYGRKTWLVKVNETLDKMGMPQIITQPKDVDLFDIYQNVEEASRTMLLKATQGGSEVYTAIVIGDYKRLAAWYNGNPNIRNEYAENVMKYYDMLAKQMDGG
ncbi:MAG: hypothetical protein AABW86_01380 [Candidatus Micrarchaeota archaeon]